MIWKDYSRLKGTHAFMSPSRYSWVNMDLEKIIFSKSRSYATQIGTLLHSYAAMNIEAKWRINKSDKRDVVRYLVVENKVPVRAVETEIGRMFLNLMLYVNDCIGYNMDPEVLLYFSKECYGTTDAISWDDKNKDLKIFDLKTGVTPANLKQLEIYAALFCLDYNIKPSQINSIELRLYQNAEIVGEMLNPIDLVPTIDKIRDVSKSLILYFGGEEDNGANGGTTSTRLKRHRV